MNDWGINGSWASASRVAASGFVSSPPLVLAIARGGVRRARGRARFAFVFYGSTNFPPFRHYFPFPTSLLNLLLVGLSFPVNHHDPLSSCGTPHSYPNSSPSYSWHRLSPGRSQQRHRSGPRPLQPYSSQLLHPVHASSKVIKPVGTFYLQ